MFDKESAVTVDLWGLFLCNLGRHLAAIVTLAKGQFRVGIHQHALGRKASKGSRHLAQAFEFNDSLTSAGDIKKNRDVFGRDKDLGTRGLESNSKIVKMGRF